MEMNMRFTTIFAALMLGCGVEDDQEDCWYCDDGSGVMEDGDGKTDGGKTGGGKTGGKTGLGATFGGEVDVDTGLGLVFYGAEDCESVYAITDAAPQDTCGCDLAFSLQLGADEGGANACEDGKGLEGLVLDIGHMDPDELMYLKEGVWEVDDGGLSSVSGGTWTFAFGQK